MKKKKGVLITGASRGIGRAAALLLARYGFHLFLNSAHHLDALKEVQKEILSRVVRVTRPELLKL